MLNQYDPLEVRLKKLSPAQRAQVRRKVMTVVKQRQLSGVYDEIEDEAESHEFGESEGIYGKRRRKRKAKRAAKKLAKAIKREKKKGKPTRKSKKLRRKAQKLKFKSIEDKKARKIAMKSFRKERRKRIKKKLGKIGKFFNKVSLAIPRGAFLALVRLNLRGLATSLKTIFETSDKKDQDKIWKKWKALGGGEKRLRKAVNKAWKKKPLVLFGKKGRKKIVEKGKRQKALLKSQGISQGELAAILAAAGAILGAISGVIAKIKPGSKVAKVAGGVASGASGLSSAINTVKGLANVADSGPMKEQRLKLLQNVTKNLSDNPGKFKNLINQAPAALEKIFENKFLKDEGDTDAIESFRQDNPGKLYETKEDKKSGGLLKAAAMLAVPLFLSK